MLRPCLFSDVEFDARSALRIDDDEAIATVIQEAISKKPEGNTFGSTERLMAHIGG
jgi:cyclic pyranopterin phosphate synthase